MGLPHPGELMAVGAAKEVAVFSDTASGKLLMFEYIASHPCPYIWPLLESVGHKAKTKPWKLEGDLGKGGGRVEDKGRG